MVSISDALNEIITNYPFIEEGLSKGIVNYSAFAREIKPQVEKRLLKSVKDGAIIMALKRISDGLSKERNKGGQNLNLTDLTVRSNLSELTYTNSATFPEKTRLLLENTSNKRGVICTFSEGIRETTFIMSAEIMTEAKRIFKGETLLSNINNLSSITIRLPEEVVYIPGTYYRILKMLAWENINIIEVLSTYTELTIVLENKNVDRAFTSLKNLGTF